MAKNETVFICSNCGNETRRKLGKCLACGQFNTFVEQTVSATAVTTAANAGLKSSGAVRPSVRAKTISELKAEPIRRTPTGIGELDRVLGGGFVEAEVVLLAGQPGSGKSTLSLRVADIFAGLGNTVLYSSGEESEKQISLRASRMGVTDDRIRIINETNLETLLGHIEEEKPGLLIVDSLQTLASSEIPGSIGSVSQSKEAAHALTRLAKSTGITMILVSQIIKSGEMAGSEAIQHIADATLIFDSDNDSPLKFLRATKNRFGDTSEVGVFQHTETGLEEVPDPSSIFLEQDDDADREGASCCFVSEGVRQIPAEVQALAVKSSLANPRKQFNGINFSRGQIVCAILDKHCKTKTFDHDIFISTVAGLKIEDPLGDLAIAASLLSTLKGKTIPSNTAFVGELSLTGHVRGSLMVEGKIREAARLGFTRIFIPASAAKGLTKKHSIEVVAINRVQDLAEKLGMR